MIFQDKGDKDILWTNTKIDIWWYLEDVRNLKLLKGINNVWMICCYLIVRITSSNDKQSKEIRLYKGEETMML